MQAAKVTFKRPLYNKGFNIELKLKFVSGKMSESMLFSFNLLFTFNFNCEGGAKC